MAMGAAAVGSAAMAIDHQPPPTTAAMTEVAGLAAVVKVVTVAVATAAARLERQ